MNVRFNRRPLVVRPAIEQPPQDVVKNTPSLWQADLDTAIRYGGELTRAALGAMEIRGDKRFVLVDTKVHMLMPGQCPSIPGWHTDGAPRAISPGRELPGEPWWDLGENTSTAYSPLGDGPPNLRIQEAMDDAGRAPRFHLLVTGEGCLTEFFVEPWDLDLDDWFRFAPSCAPVEWDWWNLHQGVLATKREWRFLIRVTESDYHEPLPPSRLAEIIRTQQMIYTPLEFGW